MTQIDLLRAPQYRAYNQPMIDPPGLVWYVAADKETDQIVACVALGPSLVEGHDGRSLVDALGRDIGALNALVDGVIGMCQKAGLGITVWMPLSHQSRIRFVMNKGFLPTSLLLRLPPPSEKAETG